MRTSRTTYEEIASSYLNGNKGWAVKTFIYETDKDLDTLKTAFTDYYTIGGYYKFLESVAFRTIEVKQ